MWERLQTILGTPPLRCCFLPLAWRWRGVNFRFRVSKAVQRRDPQVFPVKKLNSSAFFYRDFLWFYWKTVRSVVVVVVVVVILQHLFRNRPHSSDCCWWWRTVKWIHFFFLHPSSRNVPYWAEANWRLPLVGEHSVSLFQHSFIVQAYNLWLFAREHE